MSDMPVYQTQPGEALARVHPMPGAVNPAAASVPAETVPLKAPSGPKLSGPAPSVPLGGL